MQDRKKGMLFIILSSALWSTVGLTLKFIPWHPLAIVTVRNVLSLITFRVLFGGFRFDFSAKALVAASASALTIMAFVSANKLTTAANAVVLQSTAPVFVILFSAVLFGVRPGKADVIATLAVLFGIVLFFLDGLSMGHIPGNLLALCSGVGYGLSLTLNNREEVDSVATSCMGQVFSLVIGIPFVFGGGITMDAGPWIAIAMLGLVQFALGNYFYVRGVKSAPAIDVILATMLEPLLSPVWVLLFYGEAPSALALAGGAIVIVSVAALNIYKARRQRA